MGTREDFLNIGEFETRRDVFQPGRETGEKEIKALLKCKLRTQTVSSKHQAQSE